LLSSFPEDDVCIAYIYCDYKDRKNQTTVNLLSSITKQFVLQQKTMPEEVKELYVKHKHGQSSPSLDEYSKLLTVLSTRYRRSFVVVDALDELSNNEGETPVIQIKLVEYLYELQRHNKSEDGCSLFLTSRESRHINQQLVNCIRIDIRAAESDIRAYVESQVFDGATFKHTKALHRDPELRDKIICTLVDKAQGM